MLAADKQLLDAQLRNDQQELRMLELTNVVNRFQSALVPATLIAGFCFSSIVEVDIIKSSEVGDPARFFEPVFYMSASVGLALALFVTTVSSMGILFGQRLTVQANAAQGSDHDKMVRELNKNFFFVLVALGFSMAAVVIAAVAVVWVKDPSGEGDFGTFDKSYWVSITSTSLVFVIISITIVIMTRMYNRLHTPTPTSSSLKLKTTSCNNIAEVSEFYVGANVPGGSGTRSPGAGMPRSASGNSLKLDAAADERSKLLFWQSKR